MELEEARELYNSMVSEYPKLLKLLSENRSEKDPKKLEIIDDEFYNCGFRFYKRGLELLQFVKDLQDDIKDATLIKKINGLESTVNELGSILQDLSEE